MFKRCGTLGVARLVPERLRVTHNSYLTRRRGRGDVVRTAIAVEYSPSYLQSFKSDFNACPRVIDAENIHGDEHAFWTERRTFYRDREQHNFMPVWDRQAQVLIMLTREVPRIPQEAAFRLFTLALKLMLIPRLVTTAEMLLPAQLVMNTESVLRQASEGHLANKTTTPTAAASTISNPP